MKGSQRKKTAATTYSALDGQMALFAHIVAAQRVGLGEATETALFAAPVRKKRLSELAPSFTTPENR
jgi:hypothetical protein